MCAPRWHDDAIFASLIGGRSGYALTPSEARFVWGGRYESGTLIWRSRWVTTTGTIECRDALAFPGQPNTAVILRRILAVSGTARVRAILAPGADFDRYGLSRPAQRSGVWTARSGPLYLRWSGAPSARLDAGKGLEVEIEVPQGSHHDLVLEVADAGFHGAPRTRIVPGRVPSTPGNRPFRRGARPSRGPTCASPTRCCAG